MCRAIDADELIRWLDQNVVDADGIKDQLTEAVNAMPTIRPEIKQVLHPEDKVLVICSYAPKSSVIDGNLLRVVTAEEGTVLWVNPDEVLQPNYCR